jgi:hypothetical protein
VAVKALGVVAVAITMVAHKEDVDATIAIPPALEELVVAMVVLVAEASTTTITPRPSAKSASSLDTPQIGAGTGLKRIMSLKKGMLRRW